MPYMTAILIFRDKYIYADGAIREMIIWQLPEPDSERPHGLKYRLFYGYANQCLIRYENGRGKGDHRHVKDKEEDYEFVTVEKLIDDFESDIARLRGAL